MDDSEWLNVIQIASDALECPSAFRDKPFPECSTVHALAQLPTPPPSDEGSPIDEAGNDLTVAVSTAFHPDANLSKTSPDLVLLSSDGVFFYVDAHTLAAASSNQFDSLLPASTTHVHNDHGPVIPIPESADVINVVLHTVYNMSCGHYTPTIDTLISSVHALHKYGMHLKSCLAPSSSLFALILAQAPLAPIQFYALAGAYDLHELAVPISSHLLAYSLSTLTDELATCMGPIYLKRLFFLHLGRMDALRRLLLPPPHPHPPSAECDFAEQKRLTRAWALASAYLAWDARPDLSTSVIESALCSLSDCLNCAECKKSLNERVKQLVVQWSIVKRTI
ncbi:hypothetical protein OBBRIDRAFT_787270 [Obba rivulosa]|uniref:BTB domain-containing protein n=1 Tax=Obba rivulosa TaxID=1052685 RepID=A0A8E2DVX5_9APHY|nr:hypothetical protein OBBRIDRAFT_787270 [Obba rivulosa]